MRKSKLQIQMEKEQRKREREARKMLAIINESYDTQVEFLLEVIALAVVNNEMNETTIPELREMHNKLFKAFAARTIKAVYGEETLKLYYEKAEQFRVGLL